MAISRVANSTLTAGLPKSTDAWDGSTAGPILSFDSIQTLTANGTATITFNNIPQTYKHLHVRFLVRTAYAGQDVLYLYNLNGNTGNTGASQFSLYNNGSLIQGGLQHGAFSSFLAYVPGSTASANTYGVGYVDILDYTNPNKLKVIRTVSGWEDGVSGGANNFTSNLPIDIPATNPVTSLSFICNAVISAGSQIALYGIKG